MQVGEHVIDQKKLYTGLFVIGTLERASSYLQSTDLGSSPGIPLLWFAAPLSTFFWLVGSSSVLIMGHASLMEPGLERYVDSAAIGICALTLGCSGSEYGNVETV